VLTLAFTDRFTEDRDDPCRVRGQEMTSPRSHWRMRFGRDHM
jgi:hypothetical protein